MLTEIYGRRTGELTGSVWVVATIRGPGREREGRMLIHLTGGTVTLPVPISVPTGSIEGGTVDAN